MSARPVALVTGARRGIGLGIARGLRDAGYDLVLCATRDPGTLMEEFPGSAYVAGDISVAEDRERMFRTALDTFGRLDLVVNNAGVAPKVRLDILETTEESVSRLLDINLKGTFFMCQLAARHMLALKETLGEGYTPRIVNISSMSSFTASVSRGEYCMSKAGISMVTQLFAARLAAEGIGVFEIQPGIIDTDMIAVVRDSYVERVGNGLTPIPRLGTPEDIANCVLALASGKLDFACGQVIHCDGGFHLRTL